MDTWIVEGDLVGDERTRFNVIGLARQGDLQYVEVWEAARLATLCDPYKPAPVSDVRTLVVQVADPTDPETMRRVKAAIGLQLGE